MHQGLANALRWALPLVLLAACEQATSPSTLGLPRAPSFTTDNPETQTVTYTLNDQYDADIANPTIGGSIAFSRTTPVNTTISGTITATNIWDNTIRSFTANGYNATNARLMLNGIGFVNYKTGTDANPLVMDLMRTAGNLSGQFITPFSCSGHPQCWKYSGTITVQMVPYPYKLKLTSSPASFQEGVSTAVTFTATNASNYPMLNFAWQYTQSDGTVLTYAGCAVTCSPTVSLGGTMRLIADVQTPAGNARDTVSTRVAAYECWFPNDAVRNDTIYHQMRDSAWKLTKSGQAAANRLEIPWAVYDSSGFLRGRILSATSQGPCSNIPDISALRLTPGVTILIIGHTHGFGHGEAMPASTGCPGSSVMADPTCPNGCYSGTFSNPDYDSAYCPGMYGCYEIDMIDKNHEQTIKPFDTPDSRPITVDGKPYTVPKHKPDFTASYTPTCRDW